MRGKRVIVCLLCLLWQAVALGQCRLELLSDRNGEYRLEYQCKDFPVRMLGDTCCEFAVGGLNNDHHPAGSPAVPTVSRLIALPAGSTLEVTRMEANRAHVDLARPLRPARPASSKQTRIDGLGSGKPPTEDTAWLSVEPLGQMGSRQIFRVVVRPVRPTGSPLRYESATSIRATLKTSTAGVLTAPRRERYVIATRPEFVDGLQPFVQWKRQTGYDVCVVVSGSNKRDTIKGLLAPHFSNPYDLPAYLLLVGDVAQVQSYAGTTRPQGLSMHNTDLYYADYTGDYLPDVLMGRWPVNDTAELRAVVEKTLAYEQLRLADTAYLNHALLVAGRETQSPAPITTNGQVNYLKARLAGAAPALDTHCFYNPASAGQRDDVQATVRGGVGVVNYTGHGSVAGWSSPSVGFRTLDTLEASFPAVYINNCCNTSDFVGSCFGEQLLRKPQGGAVGVIGATNETLWNEDYYWAVGPKYPFSTQPAYDSLYPGALEQMLGSHPRVTTMGGLLQAGNLAVSASGSPYDKFYWEIYTLFGDPSLMPWIGVPAPIVITAEPSDLAQGGRQVRVNGTPLCRVALMQADSLVGVAETDAQGVAVLHLSQPLDTLPLLLTATGFGHRPMVDTLLVSPRLPSPLQFHDIVHHADTLAVGLLNGGPTPLTGVRIFLGCEVHGSDTLVITSLAPLADTLLVLPLLASADVACQLVAVGESGDTLALQWLQLEPVPISASIRFHLYTASGEVARRVLPQQCYRFEAEAPEGYAITAATATVDSAAPVEGALVVDFCIPDTVRHVRLHAEAVGPNGVLEMTKWLVGGSGMDGFEEGFGSYPWQHSTLRAWEVEDAHPDGGQRNARSAAIDYRQTSDLGLTLQLMAPDSISFRASTSSEANYDKLLFSVGDSTLLTLSGQRPYQRYTFALPEGSSRLRWRYVKDETTNVGDDCARLDNVTLPLALWDSAYGYFGPATALGMQVAGSVSVAPYPNPSRGWVTVVVSRPSTLWVYTASGHPVGVHRLASPGTYTLRVAEHEGVYMLRCEGQAFKVIVTNP